MNIRNLLQQNKTSLSFEVFPPRREDGLPAVLHATEQIADLRPDFMSVTCGAGGSTRGYTMELASGIQKRYHVPVLAHITCVGSGKDEMEQTLASLQGAGLENLMVLRGDQPLEGAARQDYLHASDLIRHIRSRREGQQLCIGAACYPEGHVESVNKSRDIEYLQEKVDAGCDFFTTQMFFDNNIFYNFLYRIREKGISIPVLPGIMPITTAAQLSRSVALSGTNVPERFRAIVDCFGSSPEAMQQAGIIYASEQIIDLLANGIRHIHIYSMNKPEVAEGIWKAVSALLRVDSSTFC